MNIEDIILKHHTYNGMKLIDYSEVALPIYRLTSVAIVQEKIALPTIEEFVLRTVHLGFKRVSEISGLLGISEAIAKGALSSLIQADLIHEMYDGTVQLSNEGSSSADMYSKIRPSEKQIVFDYDGLVRKVRLTAGEVYLSPKEIKDQGLTEIRAIPARRPTEEEVDLQDVSRFLSKYTAAEESEKTLLRIREITRAIRLFYKAVILIYKDKEGERYEAAFYIESGISEAHGLVFLESDGLKRLGLLSEIQGSSKKALMATYQDYLFDTHKRNSKDKQLLESKSRRKTLTLKSDMAKKREMKIKNEKYFRALAIYEHPKILFSSLCNAKQSLVIISPCITTAVINRAFLDKLDNLLLSGVEVKIGIGNESLRNTDLIQTLFKILMDKYKNFTVKVLSEVRENILIQDEDFYVITNFNLLSFKGDSKKKFQEQWGDYVECPALVRDLYGEIVSKF